MPIYAVGTDVVDLARFAATLERTPELRSRLFTVGELARGLDLPSLAGRFAVKEAFVKAMRAPSGMSWQDMEVTSDSSGAPSLQLSGNAAARVRDLGITAVHVSMSHDAGVATAFAVTEI